MINQDQIARPPNVMELVGTDPCIGLDEQHVLKNFLGKNQTEAIEICKNLAVTENFSYMAEAGLTYYLPAAASYLLSPDAKEDWEFSHGLMCSLSCQIQSGSLNGSAIPLIKEIAEYCNRNRDKFEIGDDDLFDEYLAAIRNA